MFYRVLNEGKEHDQLIKALSSKFASEGFYVKADHIGHPNGAPDQVISHVPDISATKVNHRKIIVEAETGGSISSDGTYNQWKEFSGVFGVEFHVIVPKNCLEYAKYQAQSWGIRIDNWWYM